MRSRLTPNTCAGSILALAAAAVGLAGCDKLTPNGTSETITLLRSGSEKVCVAPDVQKSLRELLLPKPDDVDDEAGTEEKQKAIKALSVSYDLTTLQSFDKGVTKASCSTTVKISTQQGKPGTFKLNFAVSPSAENANSFVVTADTDDIKASAAVLVKDAIEAAETQRNAKQQAVNQAQARTRLLATVTPKWLVGYWIDPAASPTACSDGSAFNFQANHSVEGRMVTARWVLTGDKLHIVGSSPTGAVDKTMTITDADALSFKYDTDTAGAFRRCTAEESSPPLD